MVKIRMIIQIPITVCCRGTRPHQFSIKAASRFTCTAPFQFSTRTKAARLTLTEFSCIGPIHLTARSSNVTSAPNITGTPFLPSSYRNIRATSNCVLTINVYSQGITSRRLRAYSRVIIVPFDHINIILNPRHIERI